MSDTALGASAPVGRARHRLLMTVLIVSVLLNLCFIAGAAWTHWYVPGPGAIQEQRYQRMRAELNLDARQRAAFEAYVAAMRAHAERVRREVGPVFGAAWREIAKPEADLAAVLRLFDEATDKRRELQHEMATQTLDFLANLSPAQRSKFVSIARERYSPWLRMRPIQP